MSLFSIFVILSQSIMYMLCFERNVWWGNPILRRKNIHIFHYYQNSSSFIEIYNSFKLIN